MFYENFDLYVAVEGGLEEEISWVEERRKGFYLQFS
jgi:hypothetical protein